ncbi:MAG TPA: PhzF family phenazine biosynthesis protein [Candidatus Saccharimonadales bacterium]|nr:PhzF family phenazine biosynthesis protein [Candidatus Saccharimonadales bacterium]
MKATAILVKSFTQDKSAGNPAGVVLQAEQLTDEQMQHIAKELGFAESIFVLPSDKADFRLRFFAPNHEVDLCGHGTIATFHTLLEHGLIDLGGADQKELTQETRAGLLGVTCHKDGRIVMAQTEPVFGEVEHDKTRIAKLLSIAEDDIADDLPIQVVSTGTPKLLIPLRSLEAVRAIKPDLEGVKYYCRSTTARGFYPFTTESPIPNADFFARQFNPLADENEDPVTGVAAGALGCYAKKYNLYDKQNFVVTQGYDLGKGGNMFVDVTNGVKVGGYAVVYGEEELEV